MLLGRTPSVYLGKKKGGLLNVPHLHQLQGLHIRPLELRVERVPNHARVPLVNLSRELAVVTPERVFAIAVQEPGHISVHPDRPLGPPLIIYFAHADGHARPGVGWAISPSQPVVHVVQ